MVLLFFDDSQVNFFEWCRHLKKNENEADDASATKSAAAAIQTVV
jgi:hypothetical protein